MTNTNKSPKTTKRERKAQAKARAVPSTQAKGTGSASDGRYLPAKAYGIIFFNYRFNCWTLEPLTDKETGEFHNDAYLALMFDYIVSSASYEDEHFIRVISFDPAVHPGEGEIPVTQETYVCSIPSDAMQNQYLGKTGYLFTGDRKFANGYQQSVKRAIADLLGAIEEHESGEGSADA